MQCASHNLARRMPTVCYTIGPSETSHLSTVVMKTGVESPDAKAGYLPERWFRIQPRIPHRIAGGG